MAEVGFEPISVRLPGFPGGASGKELPCQCRKLKRYRYGFDPWVGKTTWRRARNPLQSSCLENPMDRGAWQAMVPGVTKNRTQLKQLSMHMHMQLDSRAPSLPIQPCFSNCTMHAEHLGTF